jgi:hypothetical protein
MVVRIEGIGDKNFDWARGVAIQAIHKDRVENGALVDEIGLADG